MQNGSKPRAWYGAVLRVRTLWPPVEPAPHPGSPSRLYHSKHIETAAISPVDTSPVTIASAIVIVQVIDAATLVPK